MFIVQATGQIYLKIAIFFLPVQCVKAGPNIFKI
jgi:hypothetical protein